MDVFRVAIDGPAGAGKSTIAKCLAKRLGIDYIDTGAMYRAIALKLIRTGTDYTDPAALDEFLNSTDVDYFGGSVYLDGENVDAFIRTPMVSKVASQSSSVQAVRDKLVALQQGMGRRRSLVMDGRDIASKVFPDAEFKFYITASSLVRARRRLADLEAMGQEGELAQIQKEIEDRDWSDMHRKNSPLVRVEDAVVIDTSDQTLEESLAEVLSYMGMEAENETR